MKIILHDTLTNDEYGIRVCERDYDKIIAMLRDYNKLLYERSGEPGIDIIAVERFFQPSQFEEI